MKLEDTELSIRLIAGVTCLAFFAGCATAPQTARGPEYAPTASIMSRARSSQVPVETRAANYLQAAAVTAPMLGAGTPPTPAVNTYNAASAELTLLLRSAEGGRFWDHQLTLADKSRTYHLRIQPGSNTSTWSPDFFTSFQDPDTIRRKWSRKGGTREGVGGAMGGVRAGSPQGGFGPPTGMAAAVTGSL